MRKDRTGEQRAPPVVLGEKKSGEEKNMAQQEQRTSKERNPFEAFGLRPELLRAVVLTPTRELASQIAESFGAYGKHTALKHATVFGGVSQHPQAQALQRGIDILVATPGRLLDLISQGLVNLRTVDTFVLDEGERMPHMGFLDHIR